LGVRRSPRRGHRRNYSEKYAACLGVSRLANVVAQPEVLNSNYGDKIFRRLEIVCRAAFIAYEFIQNQRDSKGKGQPISTSCPPSPSIAGEGADAQTCCIFFAVISAMPPPWGPPHPQIPPSRPTNLYMHNIQSDPLRAAHA